MSRTPVLAAASAPAVEMADLGLFEKKNNPDADVHYGFQTIDPACAVQVPKEIPTSYPGIVESHPYATEMHRGATYVADAAGNAILKVKRSGAVTTVALLPAVPVTITAEMATAIGLPACTVGLAYVFEPVPTDVELGPDGQLYVSTLPGGPEDGSTGPQAKVYRSTGRPGR